MADEYINWCCENKECRRKNKVPRKVIEEASKKFKRAVFPCWTCGFVYQSLRTMPEKQLNWLECITFEGLERRLPLSDNGDGTYNDYLGKAWLREEFILQYAVDPATYIAWRDNNKKPPEETC